VHTEEFEVIQLVDCFHEGPLHDVYNAVRPSTSSTELFAAEQELEEEDDDSDQLSLLIILPLRMRGC
jgi:hypothetical protein